MIISIDFDGTIVEHCYPIVGNPMPGAFKTMKALQAAGHCLILNTCREDSDDSWPLTQAIEFCRGNGVVFDSVNTNTDDDNAWRAGTLCRKVLAGVYIDDRNFGGFPGWDRIAIAFGVEDDE